MHNRTGEDPCPGRGDRGLPYASLTDAYLKRHGPPSEAVVVAVTSGHLDFGTWERIFYGEFDGRRRKRALVKGSRHSFGIIGA